MLRAETNLSRHLIRSSVANRPVSYVPSGGVSIRNEILLESARITHCALRMKQAKNASNASVAQALGSFCRFRDRTGVVKPSIPIGGRLALASFSQIALEHQPHAQIHPALASFCIFAIEPMQPPIGMDKTELPIY